MRKLLAAGVCAVAVLSLVATAAGGTRAHTATGAVTFAAYGDSPYGRTNGDTRRTRETPGFIATIDADPDTSFVLHVGDTHAGADHCYQTAPATLADYQWVNSDELVYSLWSQYTKPLIYTPGDNEWTDCNKTGEGGGTGRDGYYDASQAGHLPGDPLDNLALVRSIFFANPGWTIGGKMHVQSQAEIGKKSERGYPENVIWQRGDVLFVTVNLPGSNNDTLPWYGNGLPLPIDQLPQRQGEEVTQRDAADLAWLDRAFQEAEGTGAGAVVIGTQADMWDPAQVANGQGLDAYDPIITHLADLVKAYGKPVLLINGDSHAYHVDQPMRPSDLPYYGFHPSSIGDVSNFTRLTVQGSTNPMEWVKVTVDPSSGTPFTFVRNDVADTLP
jgi:hypothetical protein